MAARPRRAPWSFYVPQLEYRPDTRQWTYDPRRPGAGGRVISPILVVHRHICERRVVWEHAKPRLNMDRRPFSRLDAYELEMLKALAPIYDEDAGNRVAIRRSCPERWLSALDMALGLPEYAIERAGSVSALVKLWARQGSTGWQLDDISPTIVTPMLTTKAQSSEAA